MRIVDLLDEKSIRLDAAFFSKEQPELEKVLQFLIVSQRRFQSRD